MLLVRVQVDEYVLVQHNRVVAHWTASTVWGSAVKKLLERLDFRVDEVDATSMVESFRQFGDRDSIDWDPPRADTGSPGRVRGGRPGTTT